METTLKMRKNLKAQDTLDLPMDPAFYDKLHEKIMSKVDETIMLPKPFLETPRRLLKMHWREWIYPVGGSWYRF